MFLSHKELKKIGFNSVGKNVEISAKCSFYNIKGNIGNNVRIDDYCILTGNINIGNKTHISHFVRLIAGNKNKKIKIGSFVGIGAYTTITCVSEDFMTESISNPLTDKTRKTMESNIIIKDNAKIGIRVTIIPGQSSKKEIIIGENVSVGSGVYLKKNLPSNYIVFCKKIFSNHQIKIFSGEKFKIDKTKNL